MAKFEGPNRLAQPTDDSKPSDPPRTPCIATDVAHAGAAPACASRSVAKLVFPAPGESAQAQHDRRNQAAGVACRAVKLPEARRDKAAPEPAGQAGLRPKGEGDPAAAHGEKKVADHT